MKEKLRSLRCLYGRDEDRGQLFALLPQRREFFDADNLCFDEQFQPTVRGRELYGGRL